MGSGTSKEKPRENVGVPERARTPLMRHNDAGASKRAHDILNDLQSHGKLHSQFEAASGSTRERSASDVAGGHSKSSRHESDSIFLSDIGRQQSTSAEINDGITEAIIIGTDRTMGLTSSEAERRLDVFGYNELAEKESNPCLEFLSYFWGPMPCMIWIALILEMVQSINNPDHWTDFAVLAVLQFLNGTVAFWEERNAGDAIAALKSALGLTALVKRDGVLQQIPARELVPGDIIAIKIGSKIPADCKLDSGNGESKPKPIEVDQAALTGESLPVQAYPGDIVYMGSTVKRGDTEAVVTATGVSTFFGKAASMVDSVEQTGRFQQVLFNVMLFLMAIAIILVSIILYVLLSDYARLGQLNTDNILEAVGVAVVILVASIPIAMQVVATVTMAVGARQLAEKKAIVAKLSAIEELAGMSVLCSDKTGTLTQNKLTLYDPILIAKDISAEDLVFYGALAANRDEQGQDAIDHCITAAAFKAGFGKKLDEHEELDFVPFDPVIKRVEATVKSARGEVFRAVKGAPQVVLRMAHNADEIKDEVEAAIQDLADRGYRALGVARSIPSGAEEAVGGGTGGEDKWEFLGVLSLFDPPRHDTQRTLERAQLMGISVKMITGDQTAIAKETARTLGMGSSIHSIESLEHVDGSVEVADIPQDIKDLVDSADGFAEVMPEHKFKVVEILQDQGNIVGMTGDGVNDAPALKVANIGIAVEGSTDAARGAADIVLTEPGLSVIIDAMILSRKIFQRVRNYCVFRISGTIQLIVFFFTAVFFNPHDYFPHLAKNTPRHIYLPVIAIVLITLLNDACVITIARDNVIPNRKPQPWNIGQVFTISFVLGGVACIGSLVLMIMGLNYNSGWMQNSGIACFFFNNEVTPGQCSITYPQLLTTIYLKLSLTDFITVFSARTTTLFLGRRPGFGLLTAAILATGLSTVIATNFGVSGMEPISYKLAGAIWVYTLACFVIQDLFKLFTYYIMDYCLNGDGSSRDEGLRPSFSGIIIGGAAALSGGQGEGKQAAAVDEKKGLLSPGPSAAKISYDSV